MSIFHKKFDPAIEAENCIRRIKQWFNEESGNAKGAVIGISGGKDSAVVAGLFVKAIGKERVFGVLMPNGDYYNNPVKKQDFNDAEDLCLRHLDITYDTFDITPIYEIFNNRMNNKFYKNDSQLEKCLINVQPRIRMTTLYTIAQNLNYRVIGTGNSSEAFVGYCTKWGDNACDFNPIKYFTTDEVVAIGDYLNLPYNIVHKIPADGLSGKSDEENLGVSYNIINTIITGGNVNEIDPDVLSKVINKYIYNKHKAIDNMPCYKPDYIENKF